MTESAVVSNTAKIDSAGDFSPSLGTVGRFRIVRPIARGGLGEVYLARDLELNRDVALKEIRGRHADSPSTQRRFIYEAEITGSLEHPGIVPVYGLGAGDDGRPFYAMRFIRGESLKAAIEHFHHGAARRASKHVHGPAVECATVANASAQPAQHAPNNLTSHFQRSKSELPSMEAFSPRLRSGDFLSLELRTLLRRFIDVCNAAAFAHARGILHRDIKPDNIMLGPFGETLLVDWGLAKVVGKSEPNAMDRILEPPSGSDRFATLPGSTIGTPRYMSPEQAGGAANLGPATDIYSLGATLYAILANRAPIDGATLEEVLDNARAGRWDSVLKSQPAAPKALVAICSKAMAFAPAERYESAQAIAADIDRWLADRPVTAYQDPPWVRLGRWARNHKTLLASAAVGMGLALPALGIGLAVVAGYNRQLETVNARETALRQLAEANAVHAAQQRDEADAERQSAQAVREFLQYGLLRQADPREQATSLVETPGRFALLRNPTVRELLDRANAELAGHGLDKLFPNNPFVQVEILRAVGDSYLGVGERAKALAILERALRLAEAQLGAEHRQTMRAARSLAAAHRDAGQFRAAIQLLERLTAQPAAGAPSIDQLAAWHELAVARHDAGDFVAATKSFEALLAAARSALGPRHLLTLTATCHYARLQLEEGNVAGAIAQFETAQAALESTLGFAHPNQLVAATNLASAYRRGGMTNKARALLQRALPELEKSLGAEHPDSLRALAEWAALEQAAGRVPAAVAGLERVAAGLRRLLGDEHPDALVAANNLALAYGRSGQVAKAIELLEPTLAAQEKSLGPQHPSTLATMQNLALAARQLKRFDRSGPLFGRLHAARVQQLGAAHPLAIAARGYCAIHHADVGQIARAIAELEAAQAQMAKLDESQRAPLAWISAQLARQKAAHSTLATPRK